MSPRTFSLRGIILHADNSISQPLNIFDYISPDRSRGWKVKEAYFWPQNVRELIGSSDGQYVMNACLSTDTFVAAKFHDVNKVDDNRQFAWSYQQYLIRDSSTTYDFLAPAYDGIKCGNEFLIDPDTIVVKELYLACSSISESSTSPKRNWNYLIILEEVKVSPTESIMQQVKGLGQNIA